MKKNLFKKLFCLCLCLSLCAASVIQCYAATSIDVKKAKSTAKYTYGSAGNRLTVWQHVDEKHPQTNAVYYKEDSTTVVGNYTSVTNILRPHDGYNFTYGYCRSYLNGTKIGYAQEDAT